MDERNDVLESVLNNMSRLNLNGLRNVNAELRYWEAQNVIKNNILYLIPPWPLHQPLSEEMITFLDTKCIKENDASSVVSKIIEDLKLAVKDQILFEPYGSFINGLADQESDVDFSGMEVPGQFHYTASLESRIEHMLNEVDKFLKSRQEFEITHVLKGIPFPLIKLIHMNMGKKCDISFLNHRGIRNTALMKSLIKMNPYIKPLTLYMKFLLQKYDLYGTNQITTYVLFWLVVFFLQGKTGFYCIGDLFKQGTIQFHGGRGDIAIRLRVENTISPPDVTTYLYFVFLGFLQFYANYEFAKFVICPYSGQEVDVKVFHYSQISSEYRMYLNNLNTFENLSFPYHAMNIQDPIEHNSNVSKAVRIDTINKFKLLCYNLIELLPVPGITLVKNSTLCSVLPTSLPISIPLPIQLYHYNEINLKSVRDFSQVVDGIRKMMELVLEFTPRNIFVEKYEANVRGLRAPVTYFSYLADMQTWRNGNILKIFLNKVGNLRNEQNFEVFIVCEEKFGQNIVGITFQCQNPLNSFLQRNSSQLLQVIMQS